jgi:hypothetical protein
MTPTLGRGANFAIRDGALLGRGYRYLKDRHGLLLSIGRADEARASCDNDQRRKSVDAEGDCFASARSKDHHRIAKWDEARHKHEFTEQAGRSAGHDQEDKKAGHDVSSTFHRQPRGKSGRRRWRIGDTEGT